MAVKLTQKSVENWKSSDKRQQISDHLVPGLMLIVQPTGGKSWSVRYRAAGKHRRMRLGEFPKMTLKEARAEARQVRGDVIEGDDPALERNEKKAAPTIAELSREWLDKHASGLASERAIRGYINNDIVPALGDIKVADIRRRHVIEVVEAKAEKTPRAAAQLLIYARLLLDYATDRDIIPANPLAGLKPKSIKVAGRRDAIRAVVRGRVLDHDEIRDFWVNVETSDLHRLTALCLKLVLATGQRPGEVAGMREDEISGRWWTIPAERRGKTDSAHTVYLTETALQIIADAKAEIDRLSRRRGEPWRGFIFEATPGRPITNAALCRAVDRQHVALGAKNVQPWGRWTPHDLRRTMRTGLSACRVRPDIAELTIGHVKGGIIAVYDHHSFDDERQAAWEAWEGHLRTLVVGQDPDAEQAI